MSHLALWMAGWPDFGQVTRYFRKKAKLSAKAFGVLYGQAVNGDSSAISERWILEMELEKKVPVDINKRKTIARLLKIPPMLFGLAVLEESSMKSKGHGNVNIGKKECQSTLLLALYSSFI